MASNRRAKKKWMYKHKVINLRNENIKLNSGWLEWGNYHNGMLDISIGGKTYNFGKFPFVLWKKIVKSQSAGKKIWNTIWKHKRKEVENVSK